MAKGIWERRGDVAVPVGETSREYFFALKEGQQFIAETRGARNPKQLALWWCLCKLVAENDATYDTSEKASDGLKRALHHVDTFIDRHGKLHITPKSIAFESLSQEEFNALFQAAINVIADWLGSSLRETMDRFNEMVADKRYAGMRR